MPQQHLLTPRQVLAIAPTCARRKGGKSQSHGKMPLRAANALFARFSVLLVSRPRAAPQHALSAIGNCQRLPRGYMPAHLPKLLGAGGIRKVYIIDTPCCTYFKPSRPSELSGLALPKRRALGRRCGPGTGEVAPSF